MLRAIRKQLRLIAYYAAPRKHTRSSVLFERAVIAALICCIPAAFLADRSIRRVASSLIIPGYLVRAKDGTYYAGFAETNQLPGDSLVYTESVWDRGAPVSDFKITIDALDNGWPVASSTAFAPAVFAFQPYRANDISSAALANDPAVLVAIEALIQKYPPAVLLGQDVPVAREESPRVHSPMAWVFASFTWFLMLIALFFGPLLLFEFYGRVHAVVIERRTAARLHRGQCTTCGYDLKGLEFSERCPECGELVS